MNNHIIFLNKNMKLSQAYHFLLLVILVSSTTLASVPKYAKTGCKDTCGNVRIPFPFGIGENCSLKKWYNVDCNSSTPYLSSLNHLEVLRVDLGNQTVTVKMQKFSNCSQTTKSVDLGGSPFLYSKSHNTFVYEGFCGDAVMMDNHGSVLTGCSTTCSNDTTTTGIIDANNCSGINCCQTKIPQYLESYSMNLTGIERQMSGDGACGSAYLLDKESYTEGSHLSRQSATDGTSYIPTSLQWILSYHDQEQVSCSTRWRSAVMDLGNSTPIIYGYCYTYGPSTIEGNPYLIDGYGTGTGTLKYAKRGCKDTCGNNVVIPYPFGIGASCSRNKWYTVECNSSKPYLAALDHLQLVGVNLQNQTVTVNMPKFSDCGHTSSVDLGSSPFLYSKSHNKLVYEGYCGNVFMMDDHGSFLTGCSTACYNDTTTVIINAKNCFGINCCQTTIPHYLKSYRMNLTASENQIGGDGGCGSAFLVDQNLYDKGSISRQSSAGEGSSYVPTSLLWTLSDSDNDQLTCCNGYKPDRCNVDLGNGTSMDTWKCEIGTYIENPYLADGCAARDDLDEPVSEECARCKKKGGYCDYETIYDIDDTSSKEILICYGVNESKTSLGVILGVSISMGLLFLMFIAYILYKVIKKTKERRRRNKFFKRNGGLLLKQQQEAYPCLVDQTILFTARQLEKATDNFTDNRILGRGGQGTVYKGMLVDGRIVAVKKSKIVDESQLQQFINEVVILSQVNHRNVVKLLGCCLETDVPLLVSEFIPNGTLYDRIHCETDEDPMSLNMRLQIATEVAGALSYLHSATSIPIYHRDIKTTNILLDDKYRAKVSDFGTSRFVSIDQTHLTTLVKGTFGYLDPEYFQSSQFTEKSDVYSFGVVLVELITGERPISLTRFGENRSLATHFMLAMEEGRVLSILDTIVIKEGTRDELLAVSNLAMRCLNFNGKNRPTMKEVAVELETIRMSHIPSAVQTNTKSVTYGHELSMLSFGESTSTFLSSDEYITQ